MTFNDPVSNEEKNLKAIDFLILGKFGSKPKLKIRRKRATVAAIPPAMKVTAFASSQGPHVLLSPRKM